jgi:hypothetical protein
MWARIRRSEEVKVGEGEEEGGRMIGSEGVEGGGAKREGRE